MTRPKRIQCQVAGCQSGETDNGWYLARLNGQAELCDLSVTCQCTKVVSFKEKFTTLQLIRGLYEKEIQKKVLAAGAALGEGEEMSLSVVV